MIEHLTPEQEARLAEFRDKWLAIGLSTEPSDRPRAERAIRAMYAAAGLGLPLIQWTGSPLDNILKYWDQVWDQVWAQVRDQVWDQVRAQVRDQVRAQVRDQVWDQVGDQVGDQVRDQVWAEVWAQVWDQVWGNHESYWLGFYSFFREVCALTKETDALYGFTELSQSAGWALCYEKVCFVSERHTTLKRDEQHRLHCADGPALLYPDGFAIHAWHGTRVPAEIITQPVTRDAILEQRNTEHRRVLIERVGPEQFASIMQPKLLDTDMDEAGNTRTLLCIDIHDRQYFGVRYECPSTGRQYLTPVPPGMASCAQAVAWIDGVDSEAELVART